MSREDQMRRRQERKRAFLAAYAETPDIKYASEQAGIACNTYYNWVRKDQDFAYQIAQLGSLPVPTGIKPGYVYISGTRFEQKREKQLKFLQALADNDGFIAEAALKSGVSHASHFGWIKTDDWYRECVEAVTAITAERKKRITAERLSVASVASWDDERRAQWAEYQRSRWTDEMRAITGDRTRKLFDNPEFVSRWSARVRETAWDDPEWRAAHSRAMSAGGGAQARRIRLIHLANKSLYEYEAYVALTLDAWCIEYVPHFTGSGREMDLYVPSCDLDIEIDGAGHNGRTARKQDAARDEMHRTQGYTVLRIPHAHIDDGSFTATLHAALNITSE